jgi:hypothetical protein
MFKPNKISVVAAILGSLAALGAGAGAAEAYGVGRGGPDNCIEINGSTRCEPNGEYRLHTSRGDSVTIINRQTLTCRNEQNPNEQEERPVRRPASTDEDEVSSTKVDGSICVQKGSNFKGFDFERFDFSGR